MNARLSQEMNSQMRVMQTQINRAISSGINNRVIPEIQNKIGSLPLDQNGTGTANSDQVLGSNWKEPNTSFTKKHSRSAFDLREKVDLTPQIMGF